MTRFFSCTLFCCILLLLWGATGFCKAFDERLWEKYAGIEIPAGISKGNFVGAYLEPYQIGDINTKTPFADFRIVTELKEEVPWQIVARRPENQQEEIAHQIRNLSLTEKGETWLELLIDKQVPTINAVEIMTPDDDFSRQVQVLGSNDGKHWNTLRKDGVIFDFAKKEILRHTRITFPLTSFRHIALKINNGEARPLTISSVKVLQQRVSQGQIYMIHGIVKNSKPNSSRQENSIVVCMNTVFPLDQLIITTPERNFQRSVEVQIKRETGDWERWTQGTIFSFDTATMHESKMIIDIPEVATKEFRLVFKNFDSPPLVITNVIGKGYRRLLIFKQQSDQKLYLFWGNPLAQKPRFDLAGIIAKQDIDELPFASLGPAHTNTKFAGSEARLPFTERYKYLLYIFVIMAIAGLVFLQYRVFRNVKEE